MLTVHCRLPLQPLIHLSTDSSVCLSAPSPCPLPSPPLPLQLLVLACDGIWDVMSNAEVAEFLHARPMASTDDLKKAAEALLEECLTRGSRDNMSVVLAGFAGARLRGAVGASAHPVPAPAHDAAAAAASAPAAAGGAAIGGAGSAAGPSAGAAPAAAGHTEGV